MKKPMRRNALTRLPAVGKLTVVEVMEPDYAGHSGPLPEPVAMSDKDPWGHCACCGQQITWRVLVVDEAGQHFVLGQTCALRSHGVTLKGSTPEQARARALHERALGRAAIRKAVEALTDEQRSWLPMLAAPRSQGKSLSDYIEERLTNVRSRREGEAAADRIAGQVAYEVADRQKALDLAAAEAEDERRAAVWARWRVLQKPIRESDNGLYWKLWGPNDRGVLSRGDEAAAVDLVRAAGLEHLLGLLGTTSQNPPRSGWRLLSLDRSQRPGKKMVAVFEDVSGRTKTSHFGEAGASDYTQHKDPERKRRYLERHDRGREDWDDPTTPGALSRWILWNQPTLKASIADFVRRFGLARRANPAPDDYRMNPDPERDAAMRAEAVRRFEKLQAWVSRTSKGTLAHKAIESPDGGLYFLWSMIDPRAEGPDTKLVVGFKAAREGTRASFVAKKAADGDDLYIITIYGVLKKRRSLVGMRTDLAPFRGDFVHEAIHYLDSLRWSPGGAWERAMDTYPDPKKVVTKYYRHPLEWNAHYQEGWQALEDHMTRAMNIEAGHPDSSIGLGARLTQGWDGFARVNLSGFWNPDWLASIRKSPKLWRKFLARARRSWEHSLPKWRAMLRHAKLEQKHRGVAKKTVDKAIARGKRPTKAMLAAAHLGPAYGKDKLPPRKARVRRPRPDELYEWRQTYDPADLRGYVWDRMTPAGMDTPEGEAAYEKARALVQAWEERGWLPAPAPR